MLVVLAGKFLRSAYTKLDEPEMVDHLGIISRRLREWLHGGELKL